jgi:hypothetical protein
LALGAAAVALPVLAWLDGTVMRSVQRYASANFDIGPAAVVSALVSLAVAGTVLLLALLAWRSRSSVVGLAYVVVGTFFTFITWVLFTLAAGRNGAPPALPEPIATAISRLYVDSVGPLNAVIIVGAGMLLIGIAVIARAFRDRSRAQTSQAPGPAEGFLRP